MARRGEDNDHTKSSDSLVKKSATQLKSKEAIKLKYFNILNVGSNPISLKAHLRANCQTWHGQVWHLLSFSYISQLVLLNFDMSSWNTS